MKKILPSVLVLSCLWLVDSKPVVAQQEKTFSLQSVLNATLQRNPRVAQIRAQLPVSHAARVQARQLPNPSFLYDYDAAQQQYRLGAVVVVEPPWKLVFRLLSARAQIGQTELEIARSLFLLRGQIRRTYTELVVAREATEAFQRLHQLASELVSFASKRFEQGDVARMDVTRAQIAQGQAELAMVNMRYSATRAEQQLNLLMNREPEAAIEGESVFKLHAEEVDIPAALQGLTPLIATAKANRLELKITEQAIRANAANLRLARANVLPDPRVSFGRAVANNPPDGPQARSYFVATEVEVPLLNRNQGEIARLKAVAAQLTAERRAQENQIATEVSDAYQRFKSAAEQVQIYEKRVLPAADQAARSVQVGYQLGQLDITSVLTTQRENLQVRNEYLDTLRQYQQAVTDLEQALGTPL